MRTIFFLILTISSIAQALKTVQTKPTTTTKPALLKYSVEQIFEFVLSAKNKKMDATIPFPKIYFKSQTSLSQFQDAIESQWGQRPAEITNAFADINNEIYLMDDADYYLKNDRCLDDSLAHELTHYIQSKYQKFDLNDESLEWDAVDVQTQFRDQFCPLQK